MRKKSIKAVKEFINNNTREGKYCIGIGFKGIAFVNNKFSCCVLPGIYNRDNVYIVDKYEIENK